jgi:TnpA family transposase
VESCREVARIIANATFAARQSTLWGEGTTAVASDSTHFSAFDQNIFTEWHSRYRRAKRGVLIYWTVDVAGSMAVHSQLISCSASEVHAMVEGAMRHGTDMEIEQNFVDSHGASFVGILQSCLGLINTLMIQDTLALPEWQDVLTAADSEQPGDGGDGVCPAG